MSDIRGNKAKRINIPAPVGQKVNGKVVEMKMSDKIDDYVSIKIEFAQFTHKLDNGDVWNKIGYYGIPINWTEKNKAGRLFKAMTGEFPNPDEEVNWSTLLDGKEVACIFENTVDEQTGDVDGQKIIWVGKATAGGATTNETEIDPDDVI